MVGCVNGRTNMTILILATAAAVAVPMGRVIARVAGVA
jgi:hypothetical protein